MPCSLNPSCVWQTPAYRVAYANHAIVKHYRERAAAPVWAHHGLQPCQHFVHLMARLGFASDFETDPAYTQNPPARIRQVAVPYQQVRATHRWIE